MFITRSGWYSRMRAATLGGVVGVHLGGGDAGLGFALQVGLEGIALGFGAGGDADVGEQVIALAALADGHVGHTAAADNENFAHEKHSLSVAGRDESHYHSFHFALSIERSARPRGTQCNEKNVEKFRNEYREAHESFDQTFSKVCRGLGAAPPRSLTGAAGRKNQGRCHTGPQACKQGPGRFSEPHRRARRKPAGPAPYRLAGACGLGPISLFPQSCALLSVVGRCPTPRFSPADSVGRWATSHRDVAAL